MLIIQSPGKRVRKQRTKVLYSVTTKYLYTQVNLRIHHHSLISMSILTGNNNMLFICVTTATNLPTKV